jgi:hypothetical protein
MQYKKKLFSAGLLALCLHSQGFAAVTAGASQTPAAAPTVKPPSAIVFVNGMNNTFDAALMSAQLVKKKMQDNKLDAGYQYDLAFVQAHDSLTDLLKVFAQKKNVDQGVEDFWRMAENPGKQSPDLLTQAQYDGYVKFFSDPGFADGKMFELKDHLSQYKRYLAEGRKVVLVPHSQGNFYANTAVALLQTAPTPASASYISAVGIASPANQLTRGSTYVTSSADMVMNAVRILFPVLKPTDNPGLNWADYSGHALGITYLRDRSAMQKTILQSIATRAS